MGLNGAGWGAAPKRSRVPRRIIREAVRWQTLFSGEQEVTAEVRQRFQQWLQSDPRHAVEFHAQEVNHQVARSMPADVRTRWLESAHAYERGRARRWAQWRWAGAGALVALVALGSIAWFTGLRTSRSTAEYTTRTAETRTIRFADGSVAILNTRTHLQWVGTARERRVRLLAGEAFFKVAHDTQRPFRVLVDQTTIEAVGTEFDVYRRSSGKVRLTVLEGAVKVSTLGPQRTLGPQSTLGPHGSSPSWQRQIEAHQQIEYQNAQIVEDVRRAIDEDLLWRQGAVRFEEEPLRQVIEELQRYTDRRIEIADPDLAEHPVGGRYSTRDISYDLAFIARHVPMLVQEQGATIILVLPSQVRPQRETPHAR